VTRARSCKHGLTRLIPAVLALLIVAIAAGAFAPPQIADEKADKDAPPKTIRLVIDYGDGVEKHFTRLPWTENMTVLDAMKAADRWPHGIDFAFKGKGDTALLTRIDDLENQNNRAAKRNWLYWINKEFATRGFGVQHLEPADVVTWKFTTWPER
jgi:hypothetical protein